MEPKYNVCFNKFSEHFQQMLQELYREEKYHDITLLSDDQTQFRVHRFVLSAFSPLLKKLIDNAQNQNLLIFLRGIQKDELKSILELSFNRLLSKLKLRQNDNQDDGEKKNNDNNEEENSKTNKLSILLAKKEVESGNSNYLDLLLNSYNLNDKGKQREIPRSFRKPSSSFDDKVLYDNEYYDYDGGEGDRRRFSNRFRFLYEDDSDISFAVKQSRQLDRSLRRFLSKLDKF